MDWLNIISLAIAPLTAVVGWFAGKRNRDYDFLDKMQVSIDKLVDENTTLLNDMIEIRKQLSAAKIKLTSLELDYGELKKSNEAAIKKNVELQKTIDNFKIKIENQK